MIGHINPYELNIRATYKEPTDTGTTEENVTWAQKTGDQYLNMAVAKMNPLRGSESYENRQIVGTQKNSFKMMKQNRVFSLKGALDIDGDLHYVEAIRQLQGFHNILVLDTVIKDNQ